MGYIENNLLDNEEIKYKTKNHWITFLQAIVVFGMGGLFHLLSAVDEGYWSVLGYLFQYFSNKYLMVYGLSQEKQELLL